MSDDTAMYEAQLEHLIGESYCEEDEEDEIEREYYPSNSSDQLIVNAVSGYLYPFRVGSTESLSLFHVIDATGNNDPNGVAGNVNREPNHLYYNSPHEYMRHRGGNLSKSFIESWNRKTQNLFGKNLTQEVNSSALSELRQKNRESMSNKIKLMQSDAARLQNENKIAQIELEKFQTELELERTEALNANKAKNKLNKKNEIREAHKLRNKRKAFLARERKRKERAAKEMKRVHAAKKSEKRRQAYVRQMLRNPDE